MWGIPDSDLLLSSESREWNPKSRERYPESREWNPESKDLLDYLTWGDTNSFVSYTLWIIRKMVSLGITKNIPAQ